MEIIRLTKKILLLIKEIKNIYSVNVMENNKNSNVVIEYSNYKTGDVNIDRLQFDKKSLYRFGAFLADMFGDDSFVLIENTNEGSGAQRVRIR